MDDAPTFPFGQTGWPNPSPTTPAVAPPGVAPPGVALDSVPGLASEGEPPLTQPDAKGTQALDYPLQWIPMASQQEGAAQSATEPTEPPIMVRKRSQHAEAEANCDAAAPIAADAEAARMAGRSAMASPSSAVASYERQPEAQTGKSGRSRRTPWRDMDRDARTRYAARLIGEQVEYIEVSELRAGLAAFGPAFPLPWKEGLLERLVPLGGKPAVQLAVPNSELDFLPDEEVILPFDALHDLRLAQDW